MANDNDNKFTEQKCLFCGKPRTAGKKFIGGGGAIICSDCIKRSNDILNSFEKKEQEQQAPSKPVIKPVPKPKDIKKFLDAYVIGQDQAKEYLISAIQHHFPNLYSFVFFCNDYKRQPIKPSLHCPDQ